VEYSLNSILRESDFLTHDSSGIIYACLPMTNERHKLTAVAEKIIQSLNSYFYIASYRTNIKSNIGIAIYPHTSAETEKLVHAAEKAMEESVSMGGNTFCFHI
jgi:GGDEF domain-containing protein